MALHYVVYRIKVFSRKRFEQSDQLYFLVCSIFLYVYYTLRQLADNEGKNMLLLFFQKFLIHGCLLSTVFCIFVAPLWFKFRIIPAIQRRLHAKIKFYYKYEMFVPLPFLSQMFELALYISFAKFKSEFWKKRPRIALNYVGYDIDGASKEEVLVSILTVMSLIISVIFVVVIYFLPAIK